MKILHLVLFSGAVGNMQTSQEHLKTLNSLCKKGRGKRSVLRSIRKQRMTAYSKGRPLFRDGRWLVPFVKRTQVLRGILTRKQCLLATGYKLLGFPCLTVQSASDSKIYFLFKCLVSESVTLHMYKYLANASAI